MERTTPMIRAIFFTRFHPEKGSSVLHQVPDYSVTPAPPSSSSLYPPPLFDFASISDYLIPRADFYDRLVSICVNHYRVIGHPVCIDDPKRYDRNQFIFNLAIVLDEDADMSAHASVVRKLARLLKNLEEQSSFLSKAEDERLWDQLEDDDEVGSQDEWKGTSRRLESEEASIIGSGTGQKVYALCEMILEDLNNYCECMIPIDEANTINLKLFPTRPPPAPIRAWHVPLLTIQPSLLSLPSTSDLTLTRILPYINGIRSVAQIARLADTDLSLARKAVAHLLYYGCVLLLDIFQFSAVYAPTAEIGQFVEDEEAQDEAVAYVSVGQYCQVTATDTPGDGFTTLSSSHTSHRSHRAAKKPSSVNIELSSTPTGSGAGSKPASHPSSNPDITQSGTPKPSPSGRWEWHPSSTSLTRARIVQLYTTLKPGLSLRQWCVENETLLSGVDVRRFVTFGIIKGFLYRVHRYAYANVANGTAVSDRAQPAPGAAERIARWDAQLKYTNGNGNTMTAPGAEVTKARLATKDLPLARYLDGLHCFDEICTELQMSEKEVLGKMKAAYGDVQIISR